MFAIQYITKKQWNMFLSNNYKLYKCVCNIRTFMFVRMELLVLIIASSYQNMFFYI